MSENRASAGFGPLTGVCSRPLWPSVFPWVEGCRLPVLGPGEDPLTGCPPSPGACSRRARWHILCGCCGSRPCPGLQGGPSMPSISP